MFPIRSLPDELLVMVLNKLEIHEVMVVSSVRASFAAVPVHSGFTL